jgi:hypothetical protein
MAAYAGVPLTNGFPNELYDFLSRLYAVFSESNLRSLAARATPKDLMLRNE